MALRIVSVNKVGPIWHVHANDHPGSLERAETQEKALVFVFGILTYRWECSIQLLVYGERGELQEAWAIKKGVSRKLDLLLPPTNGRSE